MFSMKQKQEMAERIEELILSYNHPEMPKEKANFKLRIEGKESWSFAVIEPNWTFDEQNKPGINPHNEAVAQTMEGD